MSIEKNAEGFRVPSAPDIEKMVLGAMLIDQQCVMKGVYSLNEEVFYVKRHRLIFRAVVNLFKASEPVDNVTVLSELQKQGQLEDAGGAIYLAEMTQEISTAANYDFHSRGQPGELMGVILPLQSARLWCCFMISRTAPFVYPQIAQ